MLEDPVARRLCQLCDSAVLPGANVRPDDDFFARGGDSMQLIRMVTVAEEEFGVEIDALAFFERPTLGSLAVAVRQAQERRGHHE
ncbi:hypothetical protein Aph01nite_70860 [Acrocarpospora phusangensis]|uniref:Carrier domain-containing protein n=1 Tax=Acrocarpospora phusangensis TaxID=1070424 RepID=A0A919QJ46_9ACTN|nr:acyl carrier protein [Acrocarpospora phusangensis]GIH28776.1 hypothetical protein Aph01nite_70860 [Acrocarpospora phusangensis]